MYTYFLSLILHLSTVLSANTLLIVMHFSSHVFVSLNKYLSSPLPPSFILIMSDLAYNTRIISTTLDNKYCHTWSDIYVLYCCHILCYKFSLVLFQNAWFQIRIVELSLDLVQHLKDFLSKSCTYIVRFSQNMNLTTERWASGYVLVTIFSNSYMHFFYSLSKIMKTIQKIQT